MNTVCTYTYIYLSMPLLAYISVLDFVGMYFWDSNPYSCDHTYPLARFTHTVLLFLLALFCIYLDLEALVILKIQFAILRRFCKKKIHCNFWNINS
jgi:hypothetical protein